MTRTTGANKYICTIILFFLFFAVFPDGPAKAAEEPAARTVAVLPFALHAGENLTYLQDGLRDMLASRLAANAGVTIVERSKVDALIQGPGKVLQQNEAQTLARALAADYIISGSLTSLGGAISIDTTVFPADVTSAPRSFYASAPQENETIGAINQLSWDIAEKVFDRTRPATPGQPVVRQPAPTQGDSTMDAFKTEHPEKALRSQGVSQTASMGSPLIMKQGIAGAQTFTKTKNFDFAIRALDVGDIDNDGQEDFVLGSTDGVHVILRKADGLQEIAVLPLSAVQKVHGISIADLNGNGQAEIYVSTEHLGNPDSFAVEWTNGSFAPLFDKAGWYIRILDIPGEGPTLIGQKGKSVSGRTGLAIEEPSPALPGIFRLRLNGQSLESGEKLVLPSSVNLFDFALADLNNDGSSEIIALSQEDKLQVFDAIGHRLWESSEYYGGTSRYIGEIESSMGVMYQTPDSYMRGARIYIPGRIIITDLNGDNLPEVIVTRNISTASRVLGNYKSYSSGEMHALSWNGIALGEIWQTRKIDGYVVDYQLAQKKTGQDETGILYVGIVLKGGALDVLSSKESTVLMYDLSGTGSAGE
jgi:TolB-like protein